MNGEYSASMTLGEPREHQICVLAIYNETCRKKLNQYYRWGTVLLIATKYADGGKQARNYSTEQFLTFFT